MTTFPTESVNDSLLSPVHRQQNMRHIQWKHCV